MQRAGRLMTGREPDGVQQAGGAAAVDVLALAHLGEACAHVETIDRVAPAQMDQCAPFPDQRGEAVAIRQAPQVPCADVQMVGNGSPTATRSQSMREPPRPCARDRTAIR